MFTKSLILNDIYTELYFLWVDPMKSVVFVPLTLAIVSYFGLKLLF
jgi:hypothetical protein